MAAGDVVVMDIGASCGGYAADVTRTIPVSGRFTPEQRAIYQLVRDAQAASEKVAKPGASWQAWRDSTRAVEARGLARLGLIESADATFDPPWADRCKVDPVACTQAFLYMAHGLGHGIGLEVHDPPHPWVGTGTFQVGDVFTIEPGDLHQHPAARHAARHPQEPGDDRQGAEDGGAVSEHRGPDRGRLRDHARTGWSGCRRLRGRSPRSRHCGLVSFERIKVHCRQGHRLSSERSVKVLCRQAVRDSRDPSLRSG